MNKNDSTVRRKQCYQKFGQRSPLLRAFPIFCTEGQKFAGRALAPDPRLAPVPPASWVQEETNKPVSIM